ncbi:MAG: 2TM domain-containing protein [Cyanothece sp. SIO1E1]|nr:2TM domain-containing protein [Cyanothece sp. SIO1E1]
MPPRWPRKPDRNDPEYRRLGDRINFALHVGIFAATTSGLWFFHDLQPQRFPWISSFTLAWLGGLFVHAVYIFAIADYSGPIPASATETTSESEDTSADST